MTTTKEKLQQAKEYIQQRDYDRARRILNKLPDNATAQKWLAKLDEIAPVAKPKKRPLIIRLLLALVVVLIVFGIAFTAYYLAVVRPADEVRSALIAYCLDLNREANTFDFSGCGDWAYGSGFDLYRDEVTACRSFSRGAESQFNECMKDEGVAPPGIILR
jgi:hypothetical protein